MEPHPIADLFPTMSDGDLAELAEDIKRNGLVDPINTFEGKILDGRHRFKACLAAGIEPVFQPFEGEDPVAYVVSKNLHRRHLTTAQKRKLVEQLLKTDPSRSDQAIAKIAQVSDKTAGAARKRLEAAAEIPHSPKRTGADGRETKAVKAAPATVPETSADPDLGTTAQPDAAHLARGAGEPAPFYDAIRYMSFEHVLAALKIWYLDLTDKRQADFEAAVMAWDEDARLTRRRARPTDSMMELTARAGGA